MASKYNMALDEFNDFSLMAYEALGDPDPFWTYKASASFVLQAVTTVGKKLLKDLVCAWPFLFCLLHQINLFVRSNEGRSGGFLQLIPSALIRAKCLP